MFYYCKTVCCSLFNRQHTKTVHFISNNFNLGRRGACDLAVRIIASTNQAAIYFDYNSPIFTNTPLSVIDTLTTVVGIEQVLMEVVVQPSPFEHNVLVNYTLENASKVQVKLYNQLGQCVYQQVYKEQQSGAQQLFVQTADLASGLYILQVETVEGSSSKKLIKQ